jgi:hypothetical protein
MTELEASVLDPAGRSAPTAAPMGRRAVRRLGAPLPVVAVWPRADATEVLSGYRAIERRLANASLVRSH